MIVFFVKIDLSAKQHVHNKLVNVLKDAVTSKTMVYSGHLSLNVAIQALKMIPTVDTQRVKESYKSRYYLKILYVHGIRRCGIEHG